MTRTWMIAAALALASPAFAAEITAAPEAIYAQRCAKCHDNPTDRIPGKDVLATRSADDVLRAFAPNGVMQPQGVGLTIADVHGLAVMLTGKEPVGEKGPDPEANKCEGEAPAPVLAGQSWNGWGRSLDNSRFQPTPGLTAIQIPRLKLKWVFAYGADMIAGQPTAVGDRLFVSSMNGRFFALNARTGCTYWSFDAGSSIKTAATVANMATAPSKFAVYIGDEKANVYALDSGTGAVLWKVKVDDHATARITGAPTLAEGKLYVPVSSLEELAAVNVQYACCTFRGSVVALDAHTGKQLWKSYTIPETPKPIRKSPAGVQMYGPAGAAIWSAPTIDLKKRRLFVGTGNSYTEIETPFSDAILAFDLDTGKRLWAQQVEAGDNYVPGCRGPGENNCPSKSVGPDMDFGSPPVLRTLPDGRDVLVAPQKVGMVYAFDADNGGKILWNHQTEAGQPPMPGRVIYAVGADGRRIYTAGWDKANGGLTALDLVTGQKLWYMPAPIAKCAWGTSNCSAGQIAAPVVIPGAVFSGAQDGHIRAYDSASGRVLWDFDTGRAFEAVNGVQAVGGSVAFGPTIANGTLFVNSGRSFYGQPGNALMAFTVDGQ